MIGGMKEKREAEAEGEKGGAGSGAWPAADPDGRPVRFTHAESRPRPDEYMPVLEGGQVRLEPMQMGHVEGLFAAAKDPEVFRYFLSSMAARANVAGYVLEAISARDKGTAIPFVTVLRGNGAPDRIVGSTRFGNIDPKNRRMEIGWTWIAKEWQRTRVNTEAKYLMLRHAFECLDSLRVELKTDSLNERSRRAILRLGAVQEGVFRNHVITPDGRIRHSVYFSIVAEDWPDAKRRLERLMDGRGDRA